MRAFSKALSQPARASRLDLGDFQLNFLQCLSMIIFWKDAVLSASVARAAAAAQAARAQVAIAGIVKDRHVHTCSVFFKVLLSPWNNPSIFETGRATAGGCAPHAIGGVSDEDMNAMHQ